MISDGENSVVVGRSDVHDGELLIPSILCFGVQMDPISEILVPGTWAGMNQIFVVVSFPGHYHSQAMAVSGSGLGMRLPLW